MFSLKDDLATAVHHFPLLRINEFNGELVLSGEIEILHPVEDKLIDTFSVEISFPKKYPFCFPKVKETSMKIERTPDRHVFTNTNTLCFAVQTEELLTCKSGITLLWFLNNVLVPRLAEEFIVINGGKYAHEYSHGPLGDIEFYCEKFGIKEHNLVIHYLKLIVQGTLPKHYEKCSCGSGVKFKKCHRILFEDLKSLGDNYLSYEIYRLENFLSLK